MKRSNARGAARPISAPVWSIVLTIVLAAGCTDSPTTVPEAPDPWEATPETAVGPMTAAVFILGHTSEIVTPPTEHRRLGFTTSFAIADGLSDSEFCISYSASFDGTAELAVDMGADFTFSYDRADLVPGGSVPIQVTYQPTNDAGPEVTANASADVTMDVEIDDLCLAGAGALCFLGDPLACAALAIAATLDSFEGELDDFDVIAASGDFVAPLGSDPAVIIPSTGNTATLQFAGQNLVSATPVSTITLAPTPSARRITPPSGP